MALAIIAAAIAVTVKNLRIIFSKGFIENLGYGGFEISTLAPLATALGSRSNDNAIACYILTPTQTPLTMKSGHQWCLMAVFREQAFAHRYGDD